jgi:hypothetical protein
LAQPQRFPFATRQFRDESPGKKISGSPKPVIHLSDVFFLQYQAFAGKGSGNRPLRDMAFHAELMLGWGCRRTAKISEAKVIEMKTTGAFAMSLLGASLILAGPAHAGTVGITYSFSGSLTAPPAFEADGLHLQASAGGTVDEFDPAVNAAWNPVTFDTTDTLDLGTALDHGTFTWTFANGDKLFGTMFEDDTSVDFTTNIGPYLQLLAFTGGTGEFAGVTGSSSGNGFLNAQNNPNFTISGSGFLTGPGLVSAPEPGSITLLGGFLITLLRYRRPGKRAVPPFSSTI